MTIIVYKLDVSRLWSSRNEISDALNIFVSDISSRERIDKFIRLQDKKEALGSYLLQHYIACKYIGISWDNVSIKRGINGKPYYNDNNGDQLKTTTCNYNVSHQDETVAIAIRLNDNKDIGIDLCNIKESMKILNSEDIYSLIFSKDEISMINKNKRSIGYFWALKESYLKFIGKGLIDGIDLTKITINLKNISISMNKNENFIEKLNGEDVRFMLIPININTDKELICAVATPALNANDVTPEITAVCLDDITKYIPLRLKTAASTDDESHK